MSSTIPATSSGFDIVIASLDSSIAVVFSKSRGAGYDAAVNFARQAARYEENQVGSSLFHFAAFGRSREQAALALALVRNLRGVKGLQVLAGGKLLQESHRVEAVLSCYLDSSSLDDPRAHCVEMVNKSHLQERFLSGIAAPKVSIGLDFVSLDGEVAHEVIPFPCRYLRARNFKFQPGHPSAEADQLRAAAVREGCDWCPNFNVE